jgi:hypothetical protein
VLTAGGGREARGREQIARLAAKLWGSERVYLADPRRVLQVRGTALVVAGHAINVARRDHDGWWRYVISFLEPDRTNSR